MTDPRDDPTRIDEPTRVDEPTMVVPAPAGMDPPGGPPPWDDRPGDGPPPSRLPWVIAAVLAAILLALLALLLLGDDDDDDDVDATASSTTELSTSTTAEATSTTEAATSTAPSTTQAVPVTLDPDDCEAAGANGNTPGLAAQTVFEAWTLGDEACADVLMGDDALAELFSRDGEGATDQFQGCTEVDQPDPHADCAFTYEGGSTHYLMSFSPTDGWQVFDVTQTAD